MKILLHGISENFLPMFSSRTLIESRLMFKSFIHLKGFLCVYGVHGLSSWLSIFCVCVCVCSRPDLPTQFVEEAIFTLFYASIPFIEY